MKPNKVKYMGLLGLLGLIGLFTGNYGFFGFFGFFGISSQTDDELLRKNIAKAGSNAFIVSNILLVLSIVGISVTETIEFAALMIATIFVIQLFVFIISFNYYEKRGDV
ncbi:DUF3796 domain-containing protein [Natranaerobius trueperi]|uniref:DUF3796 domain-containing protein n=1 Tax=Natranaerobius trueperi TaxID=759412 RepID=A0A226C330_9FIRM|nr:DUF3796 domain-containing protein [Natranaerobius trueperi]OWZ85034.1 hypothetical protein CDO51_01165 [Natranaerobius trueperi]